MTDPEMSDSELVAAAADFIGGESVKTLATDQTIRLMTVTQYVTDLCLNEVKKRRELAFCPSPETGELVPIVPYCSSLAVPTILTRPG
jgi:hypothetical protein